MSTVSAALTILAILTVGLPAVYWQLRQAARSESERDRIVREARERAAAAREVDNLELLYALPAYDPAWEAGLERLWDAVRDEQQNGESK